MIELLLTLMIQSKDLTGPGGVSYPEVPVLTMHVTCDPEDKPLLHVGFENCPPQGSSGLPFGVDGVYWVGMTSNAGQGGFFGVGFWHQFNNDDVNGPIALDCVCHEHLPYFKSLYLNDDPSAFITAPRIIKLEPDSNGNRGLFFFARPEPPHGEHYARIFPEDFYDTDQPSPALGVTYLNYEFGSPTRTVVTGNWSWAPPVCEDGEVVYGQTEFKCGKQYMGIGEDCRGDLDAGTFQTYSGADCDPSRFNYESGAYDIRLPECWSALLSPRDYFWSQVP